MTTSVQELLSSFDGLPEPERLDAALEILKRVIQFDFPPLPDEALLLSAEAIFLELDQQEAAYE